MSEGAQPAARQDEVLSEVLLNNTAVRQGGPEEEDPDLALAKLLQAQEQAWMAMAGGIGENLPPADGGEAGATAGQHGGSTGGEGGEGGEEQLTDEEMARRLQEEEEREFQQRLLALAGVGPVGAAGSGGAVPEGGDAEGYLTEDDVDPDEMTYEQLTALGEAVGTVSKGISQADIDALPQQQYYEVAGTTAGSEEQCPICRVEFEAEDVVKVLPLCRHYYHPECIGEWLKRNKVCCICNKEVLEEGKKGAEASAAAASASIGGVLGERRQ